LGILGKFFFHLEPVLKHRADKATSAEQALAMAHHEYHRRVTTLEDTRQRLEETFEWLDHEEDQLGVIHLSCYRASLTTKIDNQTHDVTVAMKTVERKRDIAVQARQERQVMEKLKDKHYLNYRREEADKEQKEIDELALYAYQRKLLQV
jgi:flagellar FliJ protein